MNWPFVFILRTVMLGLFIGAVVLLSRKNRKKIIIGCIAGLLLFLLFPVRWIYKDGGTRQYWAPLYTVIKWNRLNDSKRGTHVYLFPENFEDLDYYYNH